MAGSTFGDRLTRYVSATATAKTVPDTAPEIPEGMLETISTIVSPDEAPFLSHLARVRVEWLEMEADRLGNTCFEMRPHEIEARKRQHLPPGPVTIGLHPILAEDHLLFSHGPTILQK